MNTERLTSRKSEMRRSFLSARQAIPDVIWQQCNRQLNQHLIQWQAEAVLPGSRVMVFFGTRREPDLQPTVDVLWSRGIVVGLPVTTGTDMYFVRWQRSTALRANKWGIYEPPGDQGEVLQSLPGTWFLIPALAVNRAGYRLGYGKGYYDRFLASAPGPHTMAVLFDRFVTDELPVEPHDHPVDHVCTEAGLRTAGQPKLP